MGTIFFSFGGVGGYFFVENAISRLMWLYGCGSFGVVVRGGIVKGVVFRVVETVL